MSQTDLSDSARGLNLDQPQERARAVRATIGASTSLLDSQDAERFIELGIFAEDETIPFDLVAQLWRATAGVDDLRAADSVVTALQRTATQQAVAGADIDVESGAGGRVLDWDMDALTCALIAGVGQDRGGLCGEQDLSGW